MYNPYEIFNLPEDADYEAVKARYEELRSVYSEQRFLPGEEGAEGARKLTELEDAWSVIAQRQREKEDREKYGEGYDHIKNLIIEKNYDEAQARLDAINDRGGEWHYYQALVFYKRDWMNDCYAQLKEAVRLDPDNAQYRDSLDKMKSVLGNGNVPPTELGNQAGQEYRGNAAGNCLSNCCTALCCMECLSMPFRCCG